MAKIVAGLGTSHTPLLTLGAEQWIHRAKVDYANTNLTLSDGRSLSYPELLAEVGPAYEDKVSVEELQRKAALCEEALNRLATALAKANPDVVIIVGDDQAELFNSSNQPAFAIYHGESILMMDKLQDPQTPEWQRTVRHGYLMDKVHELPSAPEFALALIKGLIDEGVDVAASDRVEDPLKAGFGHAYGFVVKRLFGGRSIPVVPIMLNTYFPPNVPTARRCHDIGISIKRVVESLPDNLRVMIVASGGLSHFVVDETLDKRVLSAIETGDADALRSLPREALLTGSSEILNWVMVAGAVQDLSVKSIEYVPLYRTPAGTGVGAGFVIWG